MGITARWALFWLLIVLAMAAMVFKKLTVCSWVRRHNPAAAVSVIGGALGAAACTVSPSALLNHLWWAPTALDSIGAPYLLIFLWFAARERMNKRENRSGLPGDFVQHR
jgi:hypothetical protein